MRIFSDSNWWIGRDVAERDGTKRIFSASNWWIGKDVTEMDGTKRVSQIPFGG